MRAYVIRTCTYFGCDRSFSAFQWALNQPNVTSGDCGAALDIPADSVYMVSLLNCSNLLPFVCIKWATEIALDYSGEFEQLTYRFNMTPKSIFETS